MEVHSLMKGVLVQKCQSFGTKLCREKISVSRKLLSHGILFTVKTKRRKLSVWHHGMCRWVQEVKVWNSDLGLTQSSHDVPGAFARGLSRLLLEAEFAQKHIVAQPPGFLIPPISCAQPSVLPSDIECKQALRNGHDLLLEHMHIYSHSPFPCRQHITEVTW